MARVTSVSSNATDGRLHRGWNFTSKCSPSKKSRRIRATKMSDSPYSHGFPDRPDLSHVEWRHGPIAPLSEGDDMNDEIAAKIAGALERIAVANEALLALHMAAVAPAPEPVPEPEPTPSDASG